MTLLQRFLADPLSRFLAQRRVVELTGPFTHVVPDEDLNHPAVGKYRLEEGIVHGGSGIGRGTNLAGICGRTNGRMGCRSEWRRASEGGLSLAGRKLRPIHVCSELGRARLPTSSESFAGDPGRALGRRGEVEGLATVVAPR